jgi:hypothetical protein
MVRNGVGVHAAINDNGRPQRDGRDGLTRAVQMVRCNPI